MHRQLGAKLEELAKATESEFLVASAFIKANALARILASLRPDVRLSVYVRWRLEDIAAGASDLEIYSLIKGRAGAALWMCQSLHAKYYRNETSALIGSANLTNSGLGWNVDSNLEVLVSTPLSDLTNAFEIDLRRQSISVDERTIDRIQVFLNSLPPGLALPSEIPGGGLTTNWLPILRDPEMLYLAYVKDSDSIPRASLKAALHDLECLRPPGGLDRRAFEAYVAFELAHTRWVQLLESFLQEPRRFGEVAQWLVSEFQVTDGKHIWQTLLRWLLKFLPERFRADVYNYSEVVSLR